MSNMASLALQDHQEFRCFPGEAVSLYAISEYLLLCNISLQVLVDKTFVFITCSSRSGWEQPGGSHIGLSFSCNHLWINLESCEDSSELMSKMASSSDVTKAMMTK